MAEETVTRPVVPEGEEEELDTSKPQQQSSGFNFDFSGNPQFGGFGQGASLEEAYAAQEGDDEEDEEGQEEEIDEEALMEQLEMAFAAQLRMQGIEPPEDLRDHLLEFLARDMGLMGEEFGQFEEDGDEHHHHGGCSHDHGDGHDHHHHHGPQFMFRRGPADHAENQDDEDDVYNDHELENNEDDEEHDGQEIEITEQDLINMLMQQMMGAGVNFSHAHADHVEEDAEEEHDRPVLEDADETEQQQ
jgi:hypothetical protein